MAQDEKIFADGFSFKRNEKAPDFVVGRLSMKVDEAVAFIRQHEKGGWVNLNIKTARSGNHQNQSHRLSLHQRRLNLRLRTKTMANFHFRINTH